MPQTVFIVDDDQSMRTAIDQYLTIKGFTTRSFDDASAFLAVARTHPAGCVVLDIQMAALDGIAVQRALMAERIFLPVVFVTGHADIPMTVVAMKAGAHDFLTKPFHEADLLKAVSGALAAERDARAERGRLKDIEVAYANLTDRERVILAQVVEGKLNKTIAANIGMSEITVKISRRTLMEKLGAKTVPDLVKISEALKQGRASGDDG